MILIKYITFTRKKNYLHKVCLSSRLNALSLYDVFVQVGSQGKSPETGNEVVTYGDNNKYFVFLKKQVTKKS